MNFDQIPSNVLTAALIVFVIGAVVGGKVVTSLYESFGEKRKRKHRRNRKRSYNRHYHHDEDDNYPSQQGGRILFLIALFVGLGYLAYQKTIGRDPNQQATLSKNADSTYIGNPPRLGTQGVTQSGGAKGTQSKGANREIYDPAYSNHSTQDVAQAEKDGQTTDQYIIQLEAFAQKENADKKMENLQNRGFPTGYWIKETDSATLFVVYAGTFDSYEDAVWFKEAQLGGKGMIKLAGETELNKYGN